ncbi:MAG: hypothetical protein QF632_01615 [Candidatus Woesearchaeota archaeon]|jgi:Fe-S-cluster containining protein|nr:hypothetical protein [Candidatus Woesearchaeota archaeon]MDP7323440.1 hypothetical protein [Candidatus Woesearchaeota archaeon]MDP7458250.1 hypothetical protein [Candidatus Woesearchaeota archaeon]|tara:strand:- start:42 stop:299 length:258 start_codon:yes stop_codon:yes gene_type:complete
MGKILRLIETAKGVETGRKGKCIPQDCETLDGKKGGACCQLGFLCPGLKKDMACKAYRVRPPNCRLFPRAKKDLQLVKNCGFYWD